jgi:hypothetical protein
MAKPTESTFCESFWNASRVVNRAVWNYRKWQAFISGLWCKRLTIVDRETSKGIPIFRVVVLGFIRVYGSKSHWFHFGMANLAAHHSRGLNSFCASLWHSKMLASSSQQLPCILESSELRLSSVKRQLSEGKKWPAAIAASREASILTYERRRLRLFFVPDSGQTWVWAHLDPRWITLLKDFEMEI